MNILLTKFPDYIEIGPQKYKVKTDYREWIRLEMILFSDIPNENKLSKMMDIVIDKPFIKTEDDLISFIEAIMLFFNCGEVQKENKQSRSTMYPKRIYSFEKDQYYIYVDFLRYYKIDLNVVNDLHWWKFRQMLFELPDESKFKKVVMYRTVPITSHMSKEQKQFYMRMKNLYSLGKGEKKHHGSILASHMKL
jgi:hypothetical protein